MSRTDLWVGVALGLGAGYIARRLSSTLLPLARPVAKATVKAAMMGVERSREVAAFAIEEIEDIRAEVDAELSAERREQWSDHRDAPSSGNSPSTNQGDA